MQLEPEQLLHRLGPYLPTDRFRSLLAGKPLPIHGTGAAMIVDISGFTPLTVSLVKQYGPQRASEELKRKLNPMFEAIGGLVFTHGGSVIRYVGDGFTAWFPDELEHQAKIANPLSGIGRACVAALEMLETMIFFKELDIKVAVNHGSTQRWAVGDPKRGVIDTLVGPAIEQVSELAVRCQRHEARVSGQNAELLTQFADLQFERLADGDLILKKASSELVAQSSGHRWGAWKAEGDITTILNEIKPYIDPIVLEQESQGLGTLAGELRYVTPVFIRFAGIDYNHDPNALDKLNEYVRDIQSILDDTSGRLVSLEVADKGSVLFMIFGAPIAYGDDSRRAIHATLTFRDLPQIHPYLTEQNIGISRGLLYSGTLGGEVRHEYTSLGDETNIASRLMSADYQGRVLASQAIYDECSEWFEFEDSGTISPKGRIGYLQTYVPLRVKQRVKRNLRKMPIVGRDSELGTLHQALAQVGLGRPQILRLQGEAGIGKSRLAAEIVYQSNEERRTVALGYCTSTGKSTAFLPWRAIMRAILEINEDWNTTTTLEHVEKWLGNHNPEWLARLPLMNELSGLPIEDNNTTRHLTGSARQQALFSLVLDILYQQARHTPITLLIEDTHWLDEVSEALTIELITRMTAEPIAILLVLLHRSPAEAKHPEAILKTLENSYLHKHLVLAELSRLATKQLIEHHTGGMIPDELTDFVYEKTQGNPFFILEIVDSLTESDTIKRIGPRVYLEDNLNKLDLPQTVQGLILARLDNLPETEKMVLKLASVIGKQFEIRVLYQGMPLRQTPEAVMQYVRNLEKRQFITLESLYPEPIYTFRHAITQEVTYQTLLYDQRQQWHHTVGTVLENLQPNRWDRLAYHFAQTSDKARAYLYLVRAGDRAAHEFANLAAITYWGDAINLTTSRKERFDLLCKRVELLMRLGDVPNTQADLEAIQTLTHDATHNINWRIRQARYFAEHAINQGKWEEAHQHIQEALQVSEAYHDLQTVWELNSIAIRVYSYLGYETQKHQAAQKLRQLAIELNDPAKSLRLSLNDLMELATADPKGALQGLENLYSQIVKQEDPMLEANYWNSTSQIALQNGYYPLAETALRTQLRLWRQVGNRRMEGNTLYNLGVALYHVGQYTPAGAHLRDSYNIAIQVGDKWGEAHALVYLGALAFRRHAYGEAVAYIDRGLAYLESIKARPAMGRALYLIGQIWLAQDRPEEARPYFRRAIETFAASNQYESIPQVELALAYSSALGMTLPFLEDIESATASLTDGRFHKFITPDIAFWQAHYLLNIFSQNLASLREAFQNYLDQNLQSLADEPARRIFLDIGYTYSLMQMFNLER